MQVHGVAGPAHRHLATRSRREVIQQRASALREAEVAAYKKKKALRKRRGSLLDSVASTINSTHASHVSIQQAVRHPSDLDVLSPLVIFPGYLSETSIPGGRGKPQGQRVCPKLQRRIPATPGPEKRLGGGNGGRCCHFSDQDAGGNGKEPARSTYFPLAHGERFEQTRGTRRAATINVAG